MTPRAGPPIPTIALLAVMTLFACQGEVREAAVAVRGADSVAGPSPVAGPDSARIAHAVAVATQRMTEHGDRGFSVDDARSQRDWFTPGLHALLERDMSGGEVGYLNWVPYTGSQDEVGARRFDGVTRSGDTVMVAFSFAGYEARVPVTLAMLEVGGAWRIADFIYPDRSCNPSLARGLTRFAEVSTAGAVSDSAICGR